LNKLGDFLGEVVWEVPDRDGLLMDLEGVKQIAFSKIGMRNTKNMEKIRWSNVIIRACSVADQILRNKVLDELELRLKRIEVAMDIEN
jgi:hypothetical protein